MTTPEGQPEAASAADESRLGRPSTGRRATRAGHPAEVEWEPVVPEQSPLTPVFDEATRRAPRRSSPATRSRARRCCRCCTSCSRCEGYVSQDGIRFCAEVLELTKAEVSAVVTFYTMYKRTPCGEHLVSVCTNTLCAALGGDEIYRTLSRRLGVGHEETAGEPGTPSITLEHAECLAACDFAPVLQVNYEFFDNQTVESAQALVEALRRGERPLPTRGAAAHGPQDRRAGAGRDLPGPRRGASPGNSGGHRRRCAVRSSPRTATGWRPRCRTRRPHCRTCRREDD